ncbi:hypothetical protein HY642_06675 [Candidatus Woesearchaeota archaeon]|nr:hypothetical protein [Candidatus Woesearchaeota archaeon]
MLDEIFPPLEAILEQGLDLIEHKEFNKAIEFFQSHLASDHYLAYYGLATARFKQKMNNTPQDEANEIIALYSEAIKRNPAFPESHVLKGLACEQLAACYINQFLQNQYECGDVLCKIRESFQCAQECFVRALQIEPGYADFLRKSMDDYENRMASTSSHETALARWKIHSN